MPAIRGIKITSLSMTSLVKHIDELRICMRDREIAFLTPANRCMSAMFGVLRSVRSEMENTTKVVFFKANYNVGAEVLSG